MLSGAIRLAENRGEAPGPSRLYNALSRRRDSAGPRAERETESFVEWRVRMRFRMLFIVSAVVMAAPVFAHHGFGTFEVNKTVNFPGATITKLEFINPHS